MSGALKKSLASWSEEHGFTILCVLGPDGERFIVAPSPRGVPAPIQGDPSPLVMSESALRTHLAQLGMSEPEIDDAVQLSRDWATTITGSGSLLWPLQNSN
jgi:hypothetical protein